MLRTWSKVRRILCNFFDDFGLLGVILELRGHLIQDEMPKGRKRVAKRHQHGGSEARLGTVRASLTVTWGLWVYIEPHWSPVGATL